MTTLAHICIRLGGQISLLFEPSFNKKRDRDPKSSPLHSVGHSGIDKILCISLGLTILETTWGCDYICSRWTGRQISLLSLPSFNKKRDADPNSSPSHSVGHSGLEKSLCICLGLTVSKTTCGCDYICTHWTGRAILTPICYST